MVYPLIKSSVGSTLVSKSFTDLLLSISINKNVVAISKLRRWVGAKVGLVCTRTTKTNDSGFADVDWFRLEQFE